MICSCVSHGDYLNWWQRAAQNIGRTPSRSSHWQQETYSRQVSMHVAAWAIEADSALLFCAVMLLFLSRSRSLALSLWVTITFTLLLPCYYLLILCCNVKMLTWVCVGPIELLFHCKTHFPLTETALSWVMMLCPGFFHGFAGDTNPLPLSDVGITCSHLPARLHWDDALLLSLLSARVFVAGSTYNSII